MQSLLFKIIRQEFPSVSHVEIDTLGDNVLPIEYNNGNRIAKEYPPVLRWRVGNRRFKYVLKPTFRDVTWSTFMGRHTGTVVSYTEEQEKVLKLIEWSVEGKSDEEMNSLIRTFYQIKEF